MLQRRANCASFFLSQLPDGFAPICSNFPFRLPRPLLKFEPHRFPLTDNQWPQSHQNAQRCQKLARCMISRDECSERVD
eukprot:SAG31_NODE_2152_length_6315_cov_6.487452_2_plen_79_part_00